MKHTGATLRIERPWLGVVIPGAALTRTLERERPHSILGAPHRLQEASERGVKGRDEWQAVNVLGEMQMLPGLFQGRTYSRAAFDKRRWRASFGASGEGK